jgi:hypothetical protein
MKCAVSKLNLLKFRVHASCRPSTRQSLRLLFRPHNLNTPSQSGVEGALKTSKMCLASRPYVSTQTWSCSRHPLKPLKPILKPSSQSLSIDAPFLTVDAALNPASLRFLKETFSLRSLHVLPLYVHTFRPAWHAQKLSPFLFISCPTRRSMVVGSPRSLPRCPCTPSTEEELASTKKICVAAPRLSSTVREGATRCLASARFSHVSLSGPSTLSPILGRVLTRAQLPDPPRGPFRRIRPFYRDRSSTNPSTPAFSSATRPHPRQTIQPRSLQLSPALLVLPSHSTYSIRPSGRHCCRL